MPGLYYAHISWAQNNMNQFFFFFLQIVKNVQHLQYRQAHHHPQQDKMNKLDYICNNFRQAEQTFLDSHKQ